MNRVKHYLILALALMLSVGAWAQNPTAATRDVNGNWGFTKPNYNGLLSITYKDSCHLAWQNIPAGGVIGYLGFENQFPMPTLGFDPALNTPAKLEKISVGSTNPAVVEVIDMDQRLIHSTGECDIYAVFPADDDDFCYDSVAFHVIILVPPDAHPHLQQQRVGQRGV